MKIIFATGNQGKVKEIMDIWKLPDTQAFSMKEVGIAVDVEENGATFMENAFIKAEAVAKITAAREDLKDAIVMSDDSGLVVDALHGEPGVYSARYMGRDTSYEVKNKAIIQKLEGLTGQERSARFVCAVAAVLPDGTKLSAEGIMEGQIGFEIAGEHGFGYDPIFYLPEYGKTSSEILPEEKNAISHRGKALQKMQKVLAEYMSSQV